MRIFIPTSGRVHQQRTVEALPLRLLEAYDTTLVCDSGEVVALRKLYPTLKVIRTRDGCGTIGDKRQFILDNCDDPLVLMLDDDLGSWAVRKQNSETGKVVYHKALPGQLITKFAQFEKLMHDYAHGSIGHRLFAQSQDPIYYNKRMQRALAYNRNHFNGQLFKFRLMLMEDFDMQLQLMRAGFRSVTFNTLVQDQNGTNTEGGCSRYRTSISQRVSAEKLQAYHPEYVKLIEKTTAWFNGPLTTIMDVRIDWRRAAQ